MKTLPPLHGHWDRPPPPEAGDPNADILYQAIGAALTWWEGIEENFARLFSLFTEDKTGAAIRAYGSIASHSGRMEALNNASEIYLTEREIPKEQADFFDLLMKHFKKAASIRNEIAHGKVMGFNMGGKDSGFFLMPAMYNSRKISAYMDFSKPIDGFAIYRANYRYTSEVVNGFFRKFQELERLSADFVRYLLYEAPKPHIESPPE